MRKTPAAESMVMVGLMLEKEEQDHIDEQARLWVNHLSRIFSQPPQPGESVEFASARETFMRHIDPNGFEEKVYEWEGIPKEEIEKALALQQQPPLLEN